ncbi:hypothetical protein ERX37_08985 [Macrococcus hajekii]|uniref:YetF-like N-terminal transmembrane domain-containing protein n=1 Tax=Macrococcus hajekii TaxID=198482 RepID=A0A4R6BJ28_9STAP|nr:hypothetical protein [Macrococcus hajekii]TDM01617.1 hypothetical protein ERX37_08985 [Macrococcus hajekii]GGB01537.1 hypothetical protein GCM10007190_07000 [Macrococcus hajekii]
MQVDKLLFDGFDVIGRTILIGIMRNLALIFILRVGGKRTLTQLNAYDMIVTAALGSILSGIMTSKDITIAQGVTTFLTLVILQYIFTKLSFNSKLFSLLIKSNAGTSIENVNAVILESDGTRSVLTGDKKLDGFISTSQLKTS